MIATQAHSLHDGITAGLAGVAGRRAHSERPGQWALEGVRKGTPPIVAVLTEDRWLQFTAPVAGGHMHGPAVPQCAWDLLQVNGSLAGAAKLAVPPGRDVVMATCEVWLGDALADNEADDACGAAVAALVREAVDDVHEAIDRVRSNGRSGTKASGSGHDAQAVDLTELCQLAGWPCNHRAEGRLAVQLEVPGSYAQAILCPGSRIHASVELPLGQENLSPASRQAIGTVLLLLAGQVRWIRAAADADPRRELVFLEAQMGTGASATALGHLLAALSTAARLIVRELPVLARQEIAEKYLSIRGWSS